MLEDSIINFGEMLPRKDLENAFIHAQKVHRIRPVAQKHFYCFFCVFLSSFRLISALCWDLACESNRLVRFRRWSRQQVGRLSYASELVTVLCVQVISASLLPPSLPPFSLLPPLPLPASPLPLPQSPEDPSVPSRQQDCSGLLHLRQLHERSDAAVGSGDPSVCPREKGSLLLRGE